MQLIHFGDGPNVNNPAAYGYEYYYYHKDHLANIRQVFRAESAFGKNHSLSFNHKNHSSDNCDDGR